MITFITYNITEDSGLFSQLLDYVAAKDNRIVAVQEVLVDDKRRTYKGAKIIPNKSAGSQQCFLVSNNLNVIDRGSIDKKIHAVSLSMPDGQELWVVNVHGYSKSREENHNSNLYGTFALLKLTYYAYPNRIICGDFNANPFHDAITCKGAGSLYARRDLEDLDGDEEAMYNPTWRFVKERKGSRGTHLYDRVSAIVCWQMFDQILVSRRYASNIKTLVIPQRLGTIDTESARVGVKGLGHLPVLCTINLKGAHP